jgi:uncharacterized glyoxalase superfamily protein PhnB
MTDDTTDTTSPCLVWPTLRYRDAVAGADFLERAFGFVRTAFYTSDADPSVVEHAELRWPGGGGVMLGSDRGGSGWDQAPGAGATYVVTDDPDGLFERAVAAGAEVLRPLGDQSYGSRDFTVRDAEGNLWAFGTYAGE